MALTGIVYLTIKVRLNMDIPEEDIDEFVQELDYDINDVNHRLVCDNEIVAASATRD